MKKLLAFLRWLFLDRHPEQDESHAATRYCAYYCPPYPCPGANPQLCATCKQEHKPLEARK